MLQATRRHGGGLLLSRGSTGLVPLAVRPELLQDANAFRGHLGRGGEDRRPGLAGVIVVVSSPGWALAVDAATFAVSAVELALLRLPRARPPAAAALPARPRRRLARVQPRAPGCGRRSSSPARSGTSSPRSSPCSRPAIAKDAARRRRCLLADRRGPGRRRPCRCVLVLRLRVQPPGRRLDRSPGRCSRSRTSCSRFVAPARGSRSGVRRRARALGRPGALGHGAPASHPDRGALPGLLLRLVRLARLQPARLPRRRPARRRDRGSRDALARGGLLRGSRR